MPWGMNPLDLAYEVIIPACRNLKALSLDAVALLMGTCANESNLGNKLSQEELGYWSNKGVRKGGLGIFQMEKPTHDDLCIVYLKNNPFLQSVFLQYYHEFNSNFLITDLMYAAMFSRLQYMRRRDPLPEWENAQAVAAYYKQFYNSGDGAATMDRFVSVYTPLMPIIKTLDLTIQAQG